jgi:glutathione S-transferase
MLKVWGRRSSFNVQKVLWLVGELGLAMSTSLPAATSAGSMSRRFGR